MSQQLYTTNITIPLLGAAGTLGGPQAGTVPLMRVPGTAYGGGINVVRFDYATNIAMASGSAPAVYLISQNSTNGLIGTIGAAGSATTTAGTAIAGTLSSNWVPGTVSFLGIKYSHATYGGTSPANLHVSVQWYPGRGSA